MRHPPLDRGGVLRRPLRALALAFLALLGLILLALAGAWLFLATPPGERYVRGRVVKMLDERLPGNVELGELGVFGNTVVFTDVVLRDPEGEVVAKVPRVEITLGILNATRGHVDLQKVRILRPEVWLVLDERGLNLLRALSEAKAESQRKPSAALLQIRDLTLEGGRVQFRQSVTGALAEEAMVEGLGLEGELAMRPGSLGAKLKLGGQLTHPVPGALTLLSSIDQDDHRRVSEVVLSLAGVELEAKTAGEGTEREALTISRLVVPAAAARALSPGWPLRADAALEGEIARQGNLARVDLRASAAKARARLTGAVDVARLRAEELLLVAAEVDFSELVEGGPRSDVSLRLSARGSGGSLETLDGDIDLQVAESALDDQRLGPIALRASAKDGAFEISTLRAQLPGASVDASGRGTREALRLSGRLVAKDLSLLGGTLGRLARPEGLPLSGKGALSFDVRGSPAHPSLALDGAFEVLGYSDVRVERLGLRAALPDVRRPLDADAKLEAGLVSAGGRRFRDVRAELVTRGADLVADLSARGYADVGLHLEGKVTPTRDAIDLRAAKLHYPEATWTLQRPSRVSFAGGELRASELALESGRQRLTLDGGASGARLDLRASIENLALEKLPRLFLPEDLELRGEVNAQLQAAGTRARPDLTARVQLRNGRVGDFDDLALELDGRYARDRATGEVLARAFESGIKGRFDVPVRGLLKGTREEISARIAVEPTRLERLFAALGVDPGLSGSAAALIEVTGTGLDPRVRIAVDGDEVKQRTGPPGDLDLVVESKDDGTLQARIDLDTMGSQGFLVLDTPWVASQFVRGEVTGEMFIRTPVALKGEFRDVPAAALRAWELVDARFRGKATVEIDARGAVLAPEGEVRVALTGFGAEGMAPSDVQARLVADGARVELRVGADRGPQRLLRMTASFGAPIAALFAGGDLDDVALSSEGELGPLSIAELQALEAPQAEQDRARPDGVLTANWRVGGTAADPEASLTARAERLGVGAQALGRVDLAWAYADAESRVTARLSSPSGGRLELTGRVLLDASSRALRSGLAWRKAPVEARLESKDFDPAFLSNVTELVREIGGPIDANAQVAGTLGAPELRGRVEWREGRLALMGYGHYRRIHLLLEGDQETIVLHDLSAQGGAGKLVTSARGTWRGGALHFEGKGDVTRFPVVVDDQLRAILTTRFTFDGELTPDVVSVRELAIAEAQVELPEVRRKDLQDLERPSDIVLVRKGEPLYKRRRTAVARAEGGAAAAGAPAPDDAPYTGRRYLFLVEAPRNVWIKGTDVNAEIGLSDRFRIEIAEAALIYGEIRFLRGRVDVFGRRFDLLKDSTVRFSGPATLPFINVTAEHANEREAVTVFTAIRGQGKEMTIRSYSKPALSESEIYTLLATGRRTLKRGSGTSMTGEEAASVVGAYAASQVKKVIASKIPLDVLSIEAGSQGVADASLEAGVYITDKIYLGGYGRLGADREENENAYGFRLEYEFHPRWSLETEYGDALRGGADIIWSREF